MSLARPIRCNPIQSKKILIVEDDADLLTKLGCLVETILGANVVSASDGLSAVEHMQKTTFDLVISDVKMPRMDGLELLCYAQKLGIHTPFVFLSAHTDKDIVLRALKLGAYDFLEKPFLFEDLVESVGKKLFSSTVPPAFTNMNLGLKDTPRKILELVVAGQSNKKIGTELNLSEQSVKYHVGKLLDKFELKNRNELRAKILEIAPDKKRS